MFLLIFIAFFMTNFGKNIKKIRSIQKLSQSNFAELFGLSRASIGAYEEGRAEAKLDIIIKIANYFSITVDDLINQEITVNKLYHFNIFDESISGNVNIGNEVLKKIDFQKIPLIITQELLINSIEVCLKDAQNHISLPHHKAEHLAILVDRKGFQYLPEEVENEDILIVYSDFKIEKDTSLADTFWLIKSDKSLYLGEIRRLNKNAYLFFPTDAAPISLSKDKIDFVVPVESHISKKPRFNTDESDKIRKLELQVNDLYNRL